MLLEKLTERARSMPDPRASNDEAGKWIGQPARSPVLAEALGQIKRSGLHQATEPKP